MFSRRQSMAGLAGAVVFLMGGLSAAHGQELQQAPLVLQSAPSITDQKFANYAMTDGLFEVALANQAVSKSTNPYVKDFANRMLQDHTKQDQQLAQLSQKDGFQVPGAMGSDKEKRLQKFSGMSGSAFDRAYMSYEVKEHKEDITEFSNEAKTGSNPDMKSFASDAIPHLQMHLTMAKNVSQKVGAGNSSNTPWWEFWKKI